MTPAMENKTLERRKMLSGGIKLLVGIGVLFLLVPFFRSITWSESPVPENNTFLVESITSNIVYLALKC